MQSIHGTLPHQLSFHSDLFIYLFKKIKIKIKIKF